MQYKRYNSLVIGGALVILLAITGVTYKIDPGNIFSNGLVETCGNWLLKGHDVAITRNYNERLLQKYLIIHDAKSYNVLIFGSSRTMDIGVSLFPNHSVKNYSVSGASVEDDIALYFLYERLHGKPQKVVIGADAWLLNANSGQKRWKFLGKEYEYGIGRMEGIEERESDIGTIDLEKYTQLLSWPCLNESINKVKKEGMKSIERGYCLVDDKTDIPANAGMICPDGTHIPSAEARAKDAEPLARKYISGNVYSLGKYEDLDVALQTEVKAFILYLQAQGIEVVLYLTPYHPIVYSYLRVSEKYKIVLNAEKFFREVALKYGLSLVGSYDPERCGLSNEDFLDGMHMRRESVERILRGKL